MAARPERVLLSYLPGPVQSIPATAAEQDFLFRLPAHVRFAAGTELQMTLRGDAALWERLCSLEVQVNQHPVFRGGPGLSMVGTTNGYLLRIAAPVPEEGLEAGWNRVGLRFRWRKQEAQDAEVLANLSWELRSGDSLLVLVYDRLPLFPELRRFPQHVLEEQLLRTPFTFPPAEEAVASLLLPETRGEVQLRALAVLGARLGQPGFGARLRLGRLRDWQLEAEERHGVMVGLREELGDVPLPKATQAKMAGLMPGQGLLDEFIHGVFPRQRRWIVATGADEAGLQKAVLTLAHGPALLGAPPSPAVVDAVPEVSTWLESARAPAMAERPLQPAPGQELIFRGLFESRRGARVEGWSPGYETVAGGYVDLHFRHSEKLVEPGSFVEVGVQGQTLGRIALGPATAANGRAHLALPPGLAGGDSVELQFRVRLDVAEARCDTASDRDAWLEVDGETRVVLRLAPLRGREVTRVQALVSPDAFLSRLVLFLPENPSTQESEWLLDVCGRWGERLPSAPFLRPEVATYGADRPADLGRWGDRTLLILGSVAQWQQALPGDRSLMIQPGGRPGEVEIQGRRLPRSSFEPSLAFIQRLNGSRAETPLVWVGGGWETFGLEGLRRLLADPEAAGRVFGSLGAMDAAGRTASYDALRHPEESLSACLWNEIPPGLNAQETLLKQYQRETAARTSAHRSFVLSVWIGVVLLLLTVGRVWLLWERSRVEKQWLR